MTCSRFWTLRFYISYVRSFDIRAYLYNYYCITLCTRYIYIYFFIILPLCFFICVAYSLIYYDIILYCYNYNFTLREYGKNNKTIRHKCAHDIRMGRTARKHNIPIYIYLFIHIMYIIFCFINIRRKNNLQQYIVIILVIITRPMDLLYNGKIMVCYLPNIYDENDTFWWHFLADKNYIILFV